MKKTIRRWRPTPGTVFGLAALVIAIGGAAFAAIPDPSGVIHGCYDRHGSLRVIDTEANPPDTCRSNETLLTWSQQGPPGPPGDSVHRIRTFFLTDGETRTFFTEGPLSLSARCRFQVNDPSLSTGPLNAADILIASSLEHSSYEGPPETFRGAANADFGPATPEANRRLYLSPGIGSEPHYTSLSSFAASAPDGTSLTGVLFAGYNVLGRPGTCVFGGHVVVD